MKIWLISQTVNNNYDTYDSAVVFAETAEDAINMHPDTYDGVFLWNKEMNKWSGWRPESLMKSWTNPQNVKAKYLGEATEGEQQNVIVASFLAG